MVHPFIPNKGCVQGRIVPKSGFGFPGTLHHTVFSYYGRQVGEARDLATTYGIHDSLVRAIIAENRDCTFLMAVLYTVHNQEESGPVMMYCFIGLLPYLR